MSKHTPGPWKVDICYSGVFVEHAEGQVCTVFQSEVDWKFPYEANARLIAAAPDLLEALKELHGFIASGVLQFNEHGGARNLPKACERARAAIAKAEWRKE